MDAVKAQEFVIKNLPEPPQGNSGKTKKVKGD